MITYLTQIHMAAGILGTALPAEIEATGMTRPLVVTDRGVVAAGLAARLIDALPAGVAHGVFEDTPANPTEAAARAAAAQYAEGGHDGILAIGGGSALDLAKAAALMQTHEGPLSGYVAIAGGAARIRPDMPPLVAIPTTAGTGSEVGRGALVILDDGRKLALASPHLIPKAAICDPDLTLGLPPGLTAGTGMDAVSHCVETYIATAFNPPADGIALEGLRRAATALPRAVANGADGAARLDMMVAATCGALTFQKGLGAVHAASHALGGLQGGRLHHGTLNAILLPHVLEFNAPVVGHRYAALAAAMGLPAGADLAAALADLSAQVGLPARLSDIGVTQADIETAAPLAETDHTNATNPRAATAQDYRALLTAAY